MIQKKKSFQLLPFTAVFVQKDQPSSSKSIFFQAEKRYFSRAKVDFEQSPISLVCLAWREKRSSFLAIWKVEFNSWYVFK